ncbi:GNAT family N-acetyltransferase [Streptosporangium sp. NPDC020145]|uniref:GNAT family N-acetyltransferase n=1 Tax=Streptosporangium sp. NPDC020145 TaxID=3154694 RepID=UPI0034320639
MLRTQGVLAGTVVEIRSAGPGDEERIRHFLAELSPRTRHLRFLTAVDEDMAGRLLAETGRGDVLLAVAGEKVVGHAVGARAGAEVEIAVVVADAWQGRGIGSRLVRRLLRRASVNGARTVNMDVLGDNHRVLAMVRGLWPGAVTRTSQGSVEVNAPVEPALGGGVAPGGGGERSVIIDGESGGRTPFAEQGSVGAPLTP